MMSANRLILLTGATGFVGRALLRELGDRGCRLRLVVREGKGNRIPKSDAVERVITTADLWSEDEAWLEAACRGVDTIVHAAWYAEPGLYLQSPKNEDCLRGTERLARAASRAHVRRFVGIGTCFEYDLNASPLDVNAPLRPATPYGQAKADAFMTLLRFLPHSGVQFAWCRLFYLYGEGEDPRRLVPYLRSRLAAGQAAELTSGAQVRDYLDVREAARMIADVALGEVRSPVNICSGKPVTVRELAERIADEYGRRDLLRFGVRPEHALDPPRVVGVPGPWK